MAKRKTGGMIVILAVILVAIIGGIIWWKDRGKQVLKQGAAEMAPKVYSSTLTITDIDKNSIKLLSEPVIENNMPLDLEIDSLYYELWIDSAKIMQSTYPEPIVIRKSDSAKLRLPIEIKTTQLKEVIERFEREDRDSADYTMKANFRMKVPVAGKREFDVDFTKRLPAIREIKATIADMDVEKLGLKQSEIDVDVIIKNDNVFDIKLKDAKYTVKVDKDLDLEGELDEIVAIPAKGSDTVTMKMKFKTAKVPKLGWKMLFRDKQTRFVLDYSATVLSDAKVMNNTKLKTHAEGTLEEMKEFVRGK